METAFRRQFLFLYTCALIMFGLTSILPVAYMLAQFFVSVLREPSAIGSILIDARQLVLLGRSLVIALSATVVALVLGLPVAIILAAKDLPLRRLFYFLVLIPVLIPSYVMAGAWIHLLSPTGSVNTMLTNIFGPSAGLTVHSTAGCAWCLGISFFPLIAVILTTGLSQMDSNLQDIARLSTNWFGVLRYSTLPQIRPHLLASVCLVMIFVLAQYGVPSLLGINTYPVEIFAQFSAFYNDTAAVATALPLIAVVIVLILFQQRIMRNHDYVRITPSSETKSPVRINKAKYFAAAFLIVLLLVTTIVPFGSVLAYTRTPDQIWFVLRAHSSDVINTSLLALSAAVISTVIAYPIGHYLAHSHNRFSRVIDALSWLPIAIPGTIIGLGVVELANGFSVLQKGESFCGSLLFAYIGMFTAFSIRVFEASCRRADPNLAEAAAVDCRRLSQRLWHIDLPTHSGAFAASLILVFVLVVGELNATILLIPPGRETLAISIDNLLHYGANRTASALCLVEAGLVVIAATFGLLVFRTAKRVLQ